VRAQVTLLSAWVILWLVVVVPDFSLEQTDFRLFYDSGAMWLAGQNPYATTATLPNMNTPWALPIFALFSRLPLPWAFALWTAIGVVLVIWTIRTMAAKCPPDRRPYLIATFVALLPSWYVWHKGQITWLLLMCVTQAWLSKDRPITASLWLLPTILIKPPVALMAVLLPWPIPFYSGLMSLLGFSLGVTGFGWLVWRQWIDAGLHISWAGLAANASLWGTASRLDGTKFGTPLEQLSPLVFAGIVLLAVIIIWRTLGHRGDRRWALAAVSSVLLSPLGWIYYLPLAIGPVFAT
jgi:hypothetical protein